MNTTNGTSYFTDALGYNPWLFSILCSLMAVVSAVQVAFVVYFAITRESFITPKFATPFNICLICFGASMIAIYSLEAAIFMIIQREGNSNGEDAAVLYLIQSFTVTLTLLSYATYSWLRAGNLAKRVFPAFFVVLLKVVVYGLIPFSVLGDSISCWIYLYLPLDVLTSLIQYFGTAGLVMIDILDACLILAFVLYLCKYSVKGTDIDSQFLLISQFGIASCLAMTGGTASYVLYGQAYFEPLLFGFFVFGSTSLTILITMKVLLYHDKVKKGGSAIVLRSNPNQVPGSTGSGNKAALRQ